MSIPKMGQSNTCVMNLGLICIEIRVARESSACCGVNLAVAGLGFGFLGLGSASCDA
jgi:hypothetical protein